MKTGDARPHGIPPLRTGYPRDRQTLKPSSSTATRAKPLARRMAPPVRSRVEASKELEAQILELLPRLTTSLKLRAPLEEPGDRVYEAGPIVIAHVLHRSAQCIR